MQGGDDRNRTTKTVFKNNDLRYIVVLYIKIFKVEWKHEGQNLLHFTVIIWLEQSIKSINYQL